MSDFGKGPTLERGMSADVTMVLEGTYPYVSGGVSSWVHHIISGLADVNFSLVFLGASREAYGERRYKLPPNVVHLEEHFLSDIPRGDRVVRGRGDEGFHRDNARLHDALRGNGDLGAMLDATIPELLRFPTRHRDDFLYSERSWEHICERYEMTAKDRSFLEYFWTVRSMHAPLFLAASIAARVPRSRCVHVISTGFAGFLAMMLHRAWGRPLVLTEHGIYTKERRIELLQASWISDDDDITATTENATIGVFRQLWVRFFEALGKMTYAASSPIVSLYEGNRRRQIADGAARERTRVVPNGIDLARLKPLRAKRETTIPKVACLIGRVVPIKDIKTFIRTMRAVCQRMPDAVGWIAGPEDEDPTYAAECRELVKSLRVEDKVHFLGFQKIEELLPMVGVNVLTSISEAQPLALLEGLAAGVPCVASDVGCCRELLLGTALPEDRALGAAGAVVGIADPDAAASEICALLSDPVRWKAAQAAGIARVEKYYTDTQMLGRYRDIYEKAMTT
jgi:polysaccharide biosynthesis protein PelF